MSFSGRDRTQEPLQQDHEPRPAADDDAGRQTVDECAVDDAVDVPQAVADEAEEQRERDEQEHRLEDAEHRDGLLGQMTSGEADVERAEALRDDEPHADAEGREQRPEQQPRLLMLGRDRRTSGSGTPARRRRRRGRRGRRTAASAAGRARCPRRATEAGRRRRSAARRGSTSAGAAPAGDEDARPGTSAARRCTAAPVRMCAAMWPIVSSMSSGWISIAICDGRLKTAAVPTMPTASNRAERSRGRSQSRNTRERDVDRAERRRRARPTVRSGARSCPDARRPPSGCRCATRGARCRTPSDVEVLVQAVRAGARTDPTPRSTTATTLAVKTAKKRKNATSSHTPARTRAGRRSSLVAVNSRSRRLSAHDHRTDHRRMEQTCVLVRPGLGEAQAVLGVRLGADQSGREEPGPVVRPAVDLA